MTQYDKGAMCQLLTGPVNGAAFQTDEASSGYICLNKQQHQLTGIHCTYSQKFSTQLQKPVVVLPLSSLARTHAHTRQGDRSTSNQSIICQKQEA
jgi:hypothetical protein